jgi:hypothetical protein
MPEGFSNPIAGGGGALIRPSIHSPDFVAGSAGWSINKDGTAEFNGITVRGTIILGNGTTNTIILDDTRNAIFVYDNTGALVESVAPSPGTDSLGNDYVAGMASYLPGTPGLTSNLIAGLLGIGTGSSVANTTPFEIFGGTGGGAANDQPYAVLISPADSGVPTRITSQIEMFGEDAAQAREPLIRMRQAGFLVDMDVLIQGTLKYSFPGATNWAEIWHTVGGVGEPAFAAGWSNAGAPFAGLNFRHTANNTVALAGVVTRGAVAAPSTIFTLPVGYRPNRSVPIIVTAIGSDAAFQANEVLVIHTDGTVVLTSWTGTGIIVPVSLEGVEFYLS